MALLGSHLYCFLWGYINSVNTKRTSLFKDCPGRGTNLESFAFRLFSLRSSAIDISATSSPSMSHSLKTNVSPTITLITASKVAD